MPNGFQDWAKFKPTTKQRCRLTKTCPKSKSLYKLTPCANSVLPKLEKGDLVSLAGKFIHTIIDKRFSDKSVNIVMWGIYAFTFVLFGLNIALSYLKSGWFTI